MGERGEGEGRGERGGVRSLLVQGFGLFHVC
jgi:hypothetical protein